MEVFVACPYRIFPMDDYKSVFRKVSKSYSITFKFADERRLLVNTYCRKSQDTSETAIFLFLTSQAGTPNVSLELGIAVGLGKKYFILFNATIDNSDVPSDIRGFDRIQYSSNTELEAKLNLLLKQEMPGHVQTTDLTFSALKGRILEILDRSPSGLGLTQLAQALSSDKLIVSSILKAMLNDNELRTEGRKRGTIYVVRKQN